MSINARLNYVKRACRRMSATLLVVVLVACGGYGGGSSYMATTSTGQATAAMVSVGSITGFGSVHVNGVKFETTSASITVNGQAATQNDLKVGEIVEVKGHRDDSSGLEMADQIEFRHNVQGPITALDPNAETLVVLGQHVIVSADTSFGDGITPASLLGLSPNDIVEVSGMVAVNGDIDATRIAKKATGAAFEVTGAATSTDASAKTLQINALLVDYSGATLVDFASTGPKDGDLVEATGSSLGSAGELKATRLELRGGKEFKGDANEQSEIEGLITRFASASDFNVAGRPVTTSASTIFVGGTSTDLALNMHVEAEGTIDASGVLQASRVRIQLKSVSATRLVGQADSVDRTAGTVTVLGLTIGATDMTHFEDHGSQKINTFKVADVQPGDWLDIRGSVNAGAGSQLVATRMERVEPQSGVRLAGAVTAATQPNFTILTINVATTPTTAFRAGDASHAGVAAAFFDNLVGETVAVRGSWDGVTLTAQQASLGEGEDD